MKQSLKTAVAVLLIAVLLWSVSFDDVIAIAARLEWWAVLVALIVMWGELTLSAWKWSCALRLHGLTYPYGYLFRTVCAGFFLNNFLPTAVGGDAYRVYRTMPKAAAYGSRAVSAVLVDRVSGLIALLALGAGGALLNFEHEIARSYLALFAGLCVAGVALVGMLGSGWLSGMAGRLRQRKFFAALQHNLERLRLARAECVRQIALAFVFQMTSVALVYWMFMHTGETVPYDLCAMIVASGALGAALPFSLNGVGLMEGAFVLMATALGVDYDQAVAVSIVRRLMMLLLSLMCGLVYLSERDKGVVEGVSVPPPAS